MVRKVPLSTFHPEYLVDDQNREKAVVLPIAEWRQLLEQLDELEEIRADNLAVLVVARFGGAAPLSKNDSRPLSAARLPSARAYPPQGNCYSSPYARRTRAVS